MKRITLILLVAVGVTQIVWSQGTRQAAPAQTAIDDAATQLALLNASHVRLMAAATKLDAASSALYTKVYGLCGVREKITQPEAVKAANELCTLSPQWSQQAVQIQMQMQKENQVFTSVSNVLKTRHDTVKNSIGNIR